MNEYHYLQLQAARGFGPALQRQVLKYISNSDLTLTDFMTASESEWLRAGLSSNEIEALKSAEYQAKQWAETLLENDITVVGLLDESYPTNLRRVLEDKVPPILHMWGNVGLLKKPSVGFCGARDVSEQGIMFARDTAEQVASREWVIVSGHARGVDHTTHQVALEKQGYTIIVVPLGLLNFQLRADLRKNMTPEQVLIISEFQPNARWSVANAMTRNRTICGLSNAMIVVESGMTGGTFEAGKFALSVKVPLFVADYAHPAPSAAGNPFFLQKGACPIRRSKETERANLSELIESVEAHQAKLMSEPPARLVQAAFALS
jgi:DNA protecting protein DprA